MVIQCKQKQSWIHENVGHLAQLGSWDSIFIDKHYSQWACIYFVLQFRVDIPQPTRLWSLRLSTYIRMDFSGLFSVLGDYHTPKVEWCVWVLDRTLKMVVSRNSWYFPLWWSVEYTKFVQNWFFFWFRFEFLFEKPDCNILNESRGKYNSRKCISGRKFCMISSNKI